MKMLRFLACLLLAFFLCACELSTDNTPPPSPLVTFTPAFNTKMLWSARVGSGVGSDYLKLGPTIAGYKIFTADADGYITATNINTGSRFWQANSKQPITSGPAVGENIVVVGTSNAEVLAYSIDGAPLWRVKVPNQVLAAPQIGRGHVIVKTVDGKIVALAAHNGEQQWIYDHGSPILILRGGSAPQIVGNEVIAGFADGKLSAFTLEQGELLWEQEVATPEGATQVEQMVDVVADPQITNGVVYVATYQGKISAVTKQSGNVLWQQNISTYTGMALNPQNVFVTDAQGAVWAFNRANGKMMWKQTQLLNRNLTAPVIMADTLVVADGEGYLHWLAQKDGRLVARIKIADKTKIIASPIVIGTHIYVVTGDGKLVAVSAG